MKLLDKTQVIKMASNGDETTLRLHWESSEQPARETNALGILQTIEQLVAEGESEEQLWEIAYICLDTDYQLEQAGNL